MLCNHSHWLICPQKGTSHTWAAAPHAPVSSQPLLCFLSLWVCYSGQFVKMESYNVSSFGIVFLHWARRFQGSSTLQRVSVLYRYSWPNNIPSCSIRSLYTEVHSSINHNSRKAETAQVSVNGCVDK